ncbi:hypothetical protein [Kribbella capetownensis]|uniref:hypothetical protein n=1 Tax=Kribbella capetownensis TaxID=1572659 RepID=UPI0013F47EDB|nr:hypothetical protein [Kribbella capetownensis]
MSASKKCPACGWSRFYRRQHAGRTAARRHRCCPQPVVTRGCNPGDLEEKS